MELDRSKFGDKALDETPSLAITEGEMRVVLAAMTELVMVMDGAGRYLKIVSNPQLLALEPELLLGKSLFDVFPPQQAQDFMSCIERVLQQQRPLTIEYSLLIGNRETWFSTNISPLPNNQVAIVARDVTDLKATAIALQEKNEQLTQAIERLKTAQADLIQSEKMAVLGQLIAGIAHEINTPLGAIQASIGNIDYALNQSVFALPQILQVLSPEELENFLSLVEIARHRDLNLSSREERQLKRQFKAELVSYDIEDATLLAEYLVRIGLTGDLSSWLLLLRHPHNCLIFQAASYLGSVNSNSSNIQLAVTQAARIVTALKNYTRQHTSSELAKASVIEGIETVLTIYQNKIKRGVELVKNYHPVPDINCYPEKLIQVWSNLIGNAIQAMNYCGKLEISVSLEGDRKAPSSVDCSNLSLPDRVKSTLIYNNKYISKIIDIDSEIPEYGYLVVEISDNGPGISLELQEKVFEPFFTTKPYGEGTGLGLDIVKKIVSEHQGNITLASQPGRTTFTVFLPY